ncbi:MAG: LysR family transcriptional regulator [Luteolibacter sp.]
MNTFGISYAERIALPRMTPDSADCSKQMNYNHLYYFHVIALEGSLAKAARSLNVSQPTLSEQLKQMENYFEAKLFDRTGGGLRLNNNGQRAFAITQEMFVLSEKLEETFTLNAKPAKTRLEIGVATTVSRTLVTSRFVELFTDLETLVTIRQGDNDFLLHELLGTGLDILVSDRLPNKCSERGLESKIILSPEFVVVVGKENAGSISGEDMQNLSGKPFIHYTSHSWYRWEIDQFFRDNQIEPDVVAEADDVHVIKNAVMKGVGFGVIPRSILASEPASEGLVVVGSLERKFEVYALYNRKDPTGAILKALDRLSGSD